MKNVGVLVSGRGSNMIALFEAMRSGDATGRPVLVLSNEPDAPALARAASYGVATRVIPHRDFRGQGREAYDRALAAALDEAGVEIVCLAGFMRVLSAWFTDRYAGRLINIHPGLLPSFPGLHAQRQALEHGVRVAGCTVHFVDAGTDTGPIIAQSSVAVHDDDTVDTLRARILAEEHQLLPRVVSLFAQGRVRAEGRRVKIVT